MLVGLIAVASALGVGVASAVFPLVNAEAAVLVGAATSPPALAVAIAVAVAVGQTVGKVAIYEAVRAGRSQAETRQRRSDRPPGRVARWSNRLVSTLEGRWRCVSVLLLSASVGVPPLLATAAAAGVARMRRLDFVVCCLTGRTARFVVVAAPVVLAR